MGDMGDLFNDWKEHKKDVRQQRLQKTSELPPEQLAGWAKHTPYHWSRILNGEQLNWWPSTGKWSYGKKGRKPAMFFGTQNDLMNFIKNRQNLDDSKLD